jgi:F-type H+-transporting ATPase subunit alpha
MGQRASAVAQVIAQLGAASALHNCVVVVAADNEAPGLAYIAPYAAASIA